MLVSGLFEEAEVSKSFGGLGLFPLSTQHLIDCAGHVISSLTSSQRSEAKACRHLPGHSLTSAVFVMDPRSPAKKLCHMSEKMHKEE